MITVATRPDGWLRLEGEATVHDAETLLGALQAAAALREDWHVDLEQVTAVDACGAQLLLAFKRSAPTARIEASSPQLQDALGRMGLSRHLLERA